MNKNTPAYGGQEPADWQRELLEGRIHIVGQHKSTAVFLCEDGNIRRQPSHEHKAQVILTLNDLAPGNEAGTLVLLEEWQNKLQKQKPPATVEMLAPLTYDSNEARRFGELLRRVLNPQEGEEGPELDRIREMKPFSEFQTVPQYLKYLDDNGLRSTDMYMKVALDPEFAEMRALFEQYQNRMLPEGDRAFKPFESFQRDMTVMVLDGETGGHGAHIFTTYVKSGGDWRVIEQFNLGREVMGGQLMHAEVPEALELGKALYVDTLMERARETILEGRGDKAAWIPDSMEQMRIQEIFVAIARTPEESSFLINNSPVYVVAGYGNENFRPLMPDYAGEGGRYPGGMCMPHFHLAAICGQNAQADLWGTTYEEFQGHALDMCFNTHSNQAMNFSGLISHAQVGGTAEDSEVSRLKEWRGILDTMKEALKPGATPSATQGLTEDQLMLADLFIEMAGELPNDFVGRQKWIRDTRPEMFIPQLLERLIDELEDAAFPKGQAYKAIIEGAAAGDETKMRALNHERYAKTASLVMMLASPSGEGRDAAMDLLGTLLPPRDIEEPGRNGKPTTRYNLTGAVREGREMMAALYDPIQAEKEQNFTRAVYADTNSAEVIIRQMWRMDEAEKAHAEITRVAESDSQVIAIEHKKEKGFAVKVRIEQSRSQGRNGPGS